MRLRPNELGTANVEGDFLKVLEVRGWMINEIGVKTYYIIKDGD